MSGPAFIGGRAPAVTFGAQHLGGLAALGAAKLTGLTAVTAALDFIQAFEIVRLTGGKLHPAALETTDDELLLFHALKECF